MFCFLWRKGKDLLSLKTRSCISLESGRLKTPWICSLGQNTCQVTFQNLFPPGIEMYFYWSNHKWTMLNKGWLKHFDLVQFQKYSKTNLTWLLYIVDAYVVEPSPKWNHQPTDPVSHYKTCCRSVLFGQNLNLAV